MSGFAIVVEGELRPTRLDLEVGRCLMSGTDAAGVDTNGLFVDTAGKPTVVLERRSPAFAGLSSVGAPRFELGTSSPPD
jgi:hypothetical protein